MIMPAYSVANLGNLVVLARLVIAFVVVGAILLVPLTAGLFPLTAVLGIQSCLGFR